MESLRSNLAHYLVEIAAYYQILNGPTDVHRYKATMNAVEKLKKLSYVPSTSEEAQAIPGIGPSLGATIEAFVQYGSKAKLEELQELAGNIPQYIDMFTKIYDVGVVTATKFYNEGYRSLDDIPIETLTHAQRLGLKYYNELNTRIPRDEVTRMFSGVRKSIGSMVDKLQVVGSYRRGKPTSGDIDILAVSDTETLQDLVDKLIEDRVVKDVLGLGATMFRGITTRPYRRIDIRLVKQDEYPCALMYFTGSKDFNTYMRRRAISMYMKLNEYHLYFDYDGSTAEIRVERQIFIALDMEYVSPKDRVDGFDM